MHLGTCPTLWIAVVLGQQCLCVCQTEVVVLQLTYAPHYVRSWSPLEAIDGGCGPVRVAAACEGS